MEMSAIWLDSKSRVAHLTQVLESAIDKSDKNIKVIETLNLVSIFLNSACEGDVTLKGVLDMHSRLAALAEQLKDANYGNSQDVGESILSIVNELNEVFSTVPVSLQTPLCKRGLYI